MTWYPLVKSALCALTLDTGAQLGYTANAFISQKVLIKVFGKSQFPYKSVNSFIVLVMNRKICSWMEKTGSICEI